MQGSPTLGRKDDMAGQQAKAGLEVYRPGETVKYSGEYVLVDAQGNKQDYDIVTLDEGEVFPDLKGQQTNLCYMLNDTCLDEPCDVIGGETPNIE
jgi:hypothetical protein